MHSGGRKSGVRSDMDLVGIVGLIAIIACSVATGPRGNDDNRRVLAVLAYLGR